MFALPSPTPDESAPAQPFVGREIVRLERLIEASYVRRRRQKFPSYSPGKKTGDAFYRAAELCHAHGADPHAWVEAQFTLSEYTKGDLPPNHLGCAAALERWQRYVSSRHDDPAAGGEVNGGKGGPAAAAEIRCQLFYLECLTTRAALQPHDLFLAPGLPLQPWFRLLACPDVLLSQVAAQYGERARRQLRLDPGLLSQLEAMTNQPTPHESLRPVRSILSASTAGAPVPESRIIPFPRPRQPAG